MRTPSKGGIRQLCGDWCYASLQFGRFPRPPMILDSASALSSLFGNNLLLRRYTPMDKQILSGSGGVYLWKSNRDAEAAVSAHKSGSLRRESSMSAINTALQQIALCLQLFRRTGLLSAYTTGDVCG